MPARSSKPAPAEDAHRTERLLATLPEVELLGVLRGASNYTFLARLRPHEKDGLLAVYKPERGESPLWDFPSGTLFRREVAAYELSKVLGWPRIPPTVVRKTGPHGIGAMQLFDNKLRTVIWDFSGEPLPGDLCGDVERALAQLEHGKLGNTVANLLSPSETRMLKRRLRAALEPEWSFPSPTSGWSLPWPPV